MATLGILTQSCRLKDEKSSMAEIVGGKPLAQLQQEFLDMRFGMFIHFNIPTFSTQDWADPQMSPEVFNPELLDCNQWAEVAASANMQYACLTTKHHSGFCIWDTETTDYSVMNSPLKRDVVKEYADAFRKKGLKIGLYYSILDTHHNIRAGWIKKESVEFIKRQLTELLTNYGDISILVIDGWDAWWSRISYEDVPFEEIYNYIKSLQPNCLIAEHNAGKYPDSELFYTDIKHYEQNAGQLISKETNNLPAASGYHKTGYGIANAGNRCGYHGNRIQLAGYRTVFYQGSAGYGLSDCHDRFDIVFHPGSPGKSAVRYFILRDRSAYQKDGVIVWQ